MIKGMDTWLWRRKDLLKEFDKGSGGEVSGSGRNELGRDKVSVRRRGLPGRGHKATDRASRRVVWPEPTTGIVWLERSVQSNS